jgi:hypothetical protein
MVLFLSVIILKIQVDNLVVVDPERQAPIARDEQPPGAFAVARQWVRFPGRKSAELRGVLHGIEEGEHFAELVYGVGGYLQSVAAMPRWVAGHHFLLLVCAMSARPGAAR